MGYLALTGGVGYLSGSPHRSMMGTLIACGTGEVLPTTNSILCQLSAILPHLLGLACLLIPLGILKVPTVARFPPQIWGIGPQLYSELQISASPSALVPAGCGSLGLRRLVSHGTWRCAGVWSQPCFRTHPCAGPTHSRL